MLSQIGYISLPVELVEKLYYGARLTPEERVLLEGAPYVAQKLLGRIPRLEPVLEILAASAKGPAGAKGPSDAPEELIGLGAGILRLVLEYDAQIAQGRSIEAAIETVRAPAAKHDRKLIESLEVLIGAAGGAQEMTEVAVGRVRPGMVFMDDLRTHIGTLLVPKGFEVTETFLERAKNFGPGILDEKVRVMATPKRTLENAEAK